MIQTGALRVIVVRHLDDSILPARVSGAGIAIIRLVSQDTSPPSTGLEASLDRSESDFSARLASEVDRLERYAAKGNIRREEIPDEVRRLTAELRGDATHP